MKNIAIIIPAYNPDEKLVEIINNLVSKNILNIIVINDGSKKESEKYFVEIKDKCTILKNKLNEGKGKAIKKGISYLCNLNNNHELIGIVTADADGQHSVNDIINICNILEYNYRNEKNLIILGSRNFDVNKKIHFKNKMGNKISSFFILKFKKVKIKDTQSGLRGIPYKYLKYFENIKGERYEYEQNCLNFIIKSRIPFREVEIETIYNKNLKSNFNIIKDSWRIFISMLRI